MTFFLCALVCAGTTTPSKSIPTLACAMRITSPISSSLDVSQEWPCFMENYWMVSCLMLDPVFDIMLLWVFSVVAVYVNN